MNTHMPQPPDPRLERAHRVAIGLALASLACYVGIYFYYLL